MIREFIYGIYLQKNLLQIAQEPRSPFKRDVVVLGGGGLNNEGRD